MLDLRHDEQKHDGTAQPRSISQFGEFDETGTGTDLTLEWDSNDPNLHLRLAQPLEDTGQADAKDYYRYFEEAGLPDA